MSDDNDYLASIMKTAEGIRIIRNNIEFLIDKLGVTGFSIEDYKKIQDLLNGQQIEINILEHDLQNFHRNKTGENQ
jgi:hypothetical protein